MKVDFRGCIGCGDVLWLTSSKGFVVGANWAAIGFVVEIQHWDGRARFSC